EVVVLAVRERPHDAELVGTGRELRQRLTREQAGRPCANRGVTSADLRRRVGLRVPCFQVARRPGEEHDDDRLRLLPWRWRILSPDDGREPETQQARIAYLEHLAAGDADGVSVRCSQGSVPGTRRGRVSGGIALLEQPAATGQWEIAAGSGPARLPI